MVDASVETAAVDNDVPDAATVLWVVEAPLPHVPPGSSAVFSKVQLFTTLTAGLPSGRVTGVKVKVQHSMATLSKLS